MFVLYIECRAIYDAALNLLRNPVSVGVGSLFFFNSIYSIMLGLIHTSNVRNTQASLCLGHDDMRSLKCTMTKCYAIMLVPY